MKIKNKQRKIGNNYSYLKYMTFSTLNIINDNNYVQNNYFLFCVVYSLFFIFYSVFHLIYIIYFYFSP